jgi:hypothetical protein
MKALCGLHFNHDPALNPEIDLQVVLDSPTAIDDRHAHFDLHSDPAHRQLNDQAVAYTDSRRPGPSVL